MTFLRAIALYLLVSLAICPVFAQDGDASDGQEPFVDGTEPIVDAGVRMDDNEEPDVGETEAVADGTESIVDGEGPATDDADATGDDVGESEFNVYSPRTYPIDRYAAIWEKSPFIVETVVVEQSEGLEKRFALKGIAKLGDTPMAFLHDRRSLESILVVQGKLSPQGIELVSVAPDIDPRESKATIKLSEEQATISYDPALLMSTGGGDGAVPQPQPVPGQPVPPQPRPAAANPSTSRQLVPQAPQSSPPAQPPAGNIIRRRQIIVPSN